MAISPYFCDGYFCKKITTMGLLSKIFNNTTQRKVPILLSGRKTKFFMWKEKHQVVAVR